jgi:hypothetical protein
MGSEFGLTIFDQADVIATKAFTKQHYETMARTLGASVASGNHPDAVRHVAQHMADMFASDNPRFDRDRWNKAVEQHIGNGLKASGVKEGNESIGDRWITLSGGQRVMLHSSRPT